MNEAIERMIARYECRTAEDYVRALREVLQEIALLGFWRSKFFERAAFYGGTALRLLHGLDRFSEDLDFSLLRPSKSFDLSRYAQALEMEMESFGFEVSFDRKQPAAASAVQSAFLKVDTVKQLLVIEAGEGLARQLPKGRILKVKLEIDTDPPEGFETEVRYLLHPIPFWVRSYVLPDLFAGKMHAVLCRRWKNRVKGRDWYDLVWFVSNHPQLRLSHLQERMVQTGDWKEGRPLTGKDFYSIVDKVIDTVNLESARKEVEPFVRDSGALQIWSNDFFHSIIRRIELV